MKKKTTKIKSGILKYLFVLPLLLLSFCQSEFEEPLVDSESNPTINAKVLELMKSAIQSDSDQNLTQNKGTMSKSSIIEDDGQCTYFLYPMTFEVFSGDDPTPEIKEINSDEELIAFIETFTFENEVVASTPNYEMYIFFPITLLDTDGVETVLNNLTELEGTLQMAVEACESFNDSSDDGTDDGTGGGSDDGTDDGTDDGSDSGSDDSSDDGTGGGSDDGSDDSSDDGSGDGSGDDSDDGSDDGSGDGSDDSSDSGSDDSSDDSSDDGSGDDSDDGSGDGSDDSSDSGSDDSSDDGSDDGSGDDSGDGSDDSSDSGSDDSSDDGSGDDSDDSSVDENFVDSDQSDNDEDYKFCDKNSKKVYICHKGKTICVSINAIWGHLEHHEEDFLGTCDD